MDVTGLDVTVIQAGWVLLILSAPALCWLCGRAVGVSGTRTLLAVTASIALAVVAVARRGDEPLHANGHAWREAREVLMNDGIRRDALAPFIHGKGGIALQWLVADLERAITGTANPFRISRVAGAAAAGGTALLAIVLTRSVWAGLAAGGVLAVMPLARMLAVSGSALAIPAWIVPWSLALLLAAGQSPPLALLAGAAVAAALGTLSHTAMLAWPPALLVAWALAARRDVRESVAAVATLLVVGIAWIAQVATCYAMIADRNEGAGLLAYVRHGFLTHNLFVDPSWVSPALVPLVLAWVVLNLQRQRWQMMAASVLPVALVAIPLFAVANCSSDAVRYQGALLTAVTALAVAGLWRIASFARGAAVRTALCAGVLTALAALPLPSMQQPVDPSAVEHRLVLDAARRMQPGTIVVIPSGRFGGGSVLTDFPDFVLPAGSRVIRNDAFHVGDTGARRLLYLGLACVSWARDESDTPDRGHATGMRPECRALRGEARPWVVRSLTAADIPRGRDDEPWTFHDLSLDEAFGFFEP